MFLFSIGFDLIIPRLAIASEHPAVKILNKFNKSKQKDYYVNPYIVSIYALNLLYYDIQSQNIVKEYILWYLKHLNYPDKFGLTGTIYDYVVKNDKTEVSTKEYDSVDSYSGVFLILVSVYTKKTKDCELVKKNLNLLKDIAYTIAYLQDTDGLTQALPHSETKYLVDNIEAWLGLKMFSELLRNLGDKDYFYYCKIADSIKDAILKEMYDKETGKVAWAKVKDKLFWAEDAPYPDRFAKLFFSYFFGKINKNTDKKENFSKQQTLYVSLLEKLAKEIGIKP